MKKKFEINDIVKWHNNYVRVGKLITQPFSNLPYIWLVKPYDSEEFVLISEDDLEYA